MIPTCNISQGSFKAKLLIKSSLIIWVEAPMLNKYYFEALNRTFRDLMRTKNPNSERESFGGKAIILGGDFR